jgi:hypothetical protein
MFGFVYSPDCSLEPYFLVWIGLQPGLQGGVELRCAAGFARPSRIEVVR